MKTNATLYVLAVGHRFWPAQASMTNVSRKIMLIQHQYSRASLLLLSWPQCPIRIDFRSFITFDVKIEFSSSSLGRAVSLH